jgi:hypothetical protein
MLGPRSHPCSVAARCVHSPRKVACAGESMLFCLSVLRASRCSNVFMAKSDEFFPCLSYILKRSPSPHLLLLLVPAALCHRRFLAHVVLHSPPPPQLVASSSLPLQTIFHCARWCQRRLRLISTFFRRCAACAPFMTHVTDNFRCAQFVSKKSQFDD